MPGVLAPRKAWRLWQGESPCRVRASHPPVASRASMAESWWYTRRTRWAKRRQRILEAAGVTAHPAVLGQLRKGCADAEGVNAPEGNTRPSGLARKGRSAGVLRPWHAGREAAKNLGGPRGSCTAPATVYGIQLLRHGRGNPETEQCWNLRAAAAPAPGRRRSTGRGKARCMPWGSLSTHSTQRWGKPTTRGRT